MSYFISLILMSFFTQVIASVVPFDEDANVITSSYEKSKWVIFTSKSEKMYVLEEAIRSIHFNFTKINRLLDTNRSKRIEFKSKILNQCTFAMMMIEDDFTIKKTLLEMRRKQLRQFVLPFYTERNLDNNILKTLLSMENQLNSIKKEVDKELGESKTRQTRSSLLDVENSANKIQETIRNPLDEVKEINVNKGKFIASSFLFNIDSKQLF
ncbi:MAG: hypothetical protein JO129_01735 [Candidatus Dependentiae bacterium]|nr:hypothetical protein [Candidatus Dependentiae bacterium]